MRRIDITLQWRSHSYLVSGFIEGPVSLAWTLALRLICVQMLKHSRAGVPMEVMGLMLGEFVDEYTVQVIDVFAMPQSGTTVTVESVDHVFQTKMMDMLKQTGRWVQLPS